MSEEDDDDDVATVTLTSAHHAVAGPVRQRLQEESSASGQRPPPPVTQGRLTVPFTNSDITLSFINYQCKTHCTSHSLLFKYVVYLLGFRGNRLCSANLTDYCPMKGLYLQIKITAL